MNLTDNYRIFNPNTNEYIPSFRCLMELLHIDHILVHKRSPNRYNVTKLTPYILSTNHRLKLEIKNNKS